jgi:hypothetical protein
MRNTKHCNSYVQNREQSAVYEVIGTDDPHLLVL